MNAVITFYGELTDVTNCGTITLGANNVSELHSVLAAKFPGLNEKTFVVAINNKIVSGNEIINEGDQIALLPPFAGG